MTVLIVLLLAGSLLVNLGMVVVFAKSRTVRREHHRELMEELRQLRTRATVPAVIQTRRVI